jgi:hypothetical protein
LAEALMWPRLIEVGDVLAQHAREVALPKDEQVIEALAAHAFQKTLAGRLGLLRPVWRAQDRDAACRSDGRERGPVVLAVYSIHGDFLAVGVRECPDLPADGVNGQDRPSTARAPPPSIRQS